MATLSHFKNYESCCRTCLNNVSTKMYDMFIDTQDSNSVADIFTLCTSLKVEKEDNLPKQLCSSCYKCLISFYDFRKLAEQIDTKLKKSNVKNGKVDDPDTTEKGFQIDVKDENVKSVLKVDCELLSNETENLISVEEIVKHEIKFDDENDNLNSEFTFEDCNNQTDDIKIDLKCELCYKKFKNLTRLEKHLQRHNSDVVYNCSICCQSFKRHYKYVKHLLTHGKEVPEINHNQDDANKDVECEICSAKYKSLNSLAAHMKKHTKKDRVLSCSICGKVFKKVSHVKRHELCHEVNRPFKCTVCPKRFNTEGLLNEHLNKHNKVKPHECPMCNKSFAHFSTLSTHIKIHTREKPFLCPSCGKKFDSSTNLNQHMRRHMGIKVFACSLCPKKFVSKGELNSHRVTHTGERPWRCTECGATFTKRSTLDQHRLRHAGVKEHQCDACPMRFITKDHLKRHYRIHTGEKPYRCELCERAFTQSNDLVKHRRAHLGDKLYKCTECTQSYRLQSELRQHISEHYISLQLQALSGEKPADPDNSAANQTLDGVDLRTVDGGKDK